MFKVRLLTFRCLHYTIEGVKFLLRKLRLLVVEDEKKLCVGRLLMFKECLKYNIVPFMIEEDLKMFYYRGLKEWNNEKGYLMDTCLTAQDRYKEYLDYFRISYS